MHKASFKHVIGNTELGKITPELYPNQNDDSDQEEEDSDKEEEDLKGSDDNQSNRNVDDNT